MPGAARVFDEAEPWTFADADPAADAKLMHVALTRAEDDLFVTHAEPSPFIDRMSKSGLTIPL
ncbi:hypothetical protein [Fimbriiglobus ruber]|uniref:UvrD-like helicase C-terminal domain-containing protein n=1 Tax=Fimbriiglobus ruber TaxID=1908690 RepID=A0A225DHA6_9BACT|nr:hypothetical protein [Fimbriiglobus ruber]OWK35775.1 hypothetical protein FRUB_08338 [Fimbriiglobus ruber]